MKTFHHPNVLPLLGVCIDYDDEDALKIIIPFMVNGDLRNFLKNNRVAPNNIQEYPEVRTHTHIYILYIYTHVYTYCILIIVISHIYTLPSGY